MNEENSPFEPKAVRQREEMAFRFKVQAEKALEKYKMAKRLEALRRMKQLALEQVETEGYSDAMGMYIIDTAKEKKEESDVTSFTITYGFRDGLKSCVKKLFRSMYRERKFELTWLQFLNITLCLQISFTYTLKHMWLVCRWGAILVLLVYILFGILIAMPIYMVLMFLGNYSGRSYIKFWDCVPLLKGVAYSIALISILTELFSMVFAGLSLSFMVDVIMAPITPWYDCNFVNANKDCKPKSKVVESYNYTCCIKGSKNCSDSEWASLVFKYEAYDYYKMHQLWNGYEDHRTTIFPMKTIICVGFCWILMLIMMLWGLRRFRGIMTVISVGMLIGIFVPWVIVTLYMTDYSMFEELAPNWLDVFNYEFWIDVIVHSLHRELAGDVITFSSVSSPGISPTIDTICIYVAKFIFLVFITVWLSISVSLVQARYQILTTSCMDVHALAVFFGLFPEVLSPSKIALFIYFFVLFFWCFAGSLYALNSFIWSLLEQFPKLIKLKMPICSLFCVSCFCLSFLFLRSDVEVLYELWIQKTCVVTKVALLFFTLLGIFLYSLTRIADDFHFTYGQLLHPLWLHGIKIAMLLIIVITVLRMTLFPGFGDFADITITLCVTVPTIIGACYAIVRYKTGSSLTVVAADPSWGPIGFKKQLARSRFDPKRDLRYRSAIQNCKHSCLLNSTTLVTESKYWSAKRMLAGDIDPEHLQ